MTLQDIISLRLHNQLLANKKYDCPEDTVRHMGAVQAQDYYPSLWAFGFRTKGATKETVEQAINDRKILRTWPMRGTLHFTPAEDAQWMVELFANKKQHWSIYNKIGLDEETFSSSAKVITKALSGGNRLTRKEIYQALNQNGIDTSSSSWGGRGMHILNYLARQGLICCGPRRGKQFTFVLLDEWVQNPRRLTREEGLAELAIRYFTSHGPATEKDFAWWIGLALREVRESLDLAGEALISVQLKSSTFWLAKEHTKAASLPTDVHLLSYLDEYLIAYKDREAVLSKYATEPSQKEQTMLKPVVVVDGHVAGAWHRVLKPNRIEVTIHPFERWSRQTLNKVEEAFERYASFMDRKVEIVDVVM